MCKVPLTCLAILLVGTTARADLVSCLPIDHARDAYPAAILTAPLPVAARISESGSIATAVATELAASFEPASQTEHVITLPPGPDSVLLAASGLLSLGAIQLGRNVRKLHFGLMPEWYHDGGPTQVGHATAWDLGFSHSAMPVCCFELPITAGSERPPARWRLQLEPKNGLHSQCIYDESDYIQGAIILLFCILPCKG